MDNELLLEGEFFDTVLFDVPKVKIVQLSDNLCHDLTVVLPSAEMHPENQQLVQNIISALGYNFNSEINMLTADDGEVLDAHALTALNCSKYLIFGRTTPLISAQWDVRLDTLAIIQEKEWVFTSKLELFHTDKTKKLALWKAIQHWKKNANTA